MTLTKNSSEKELRKAWTKYQEESHQDDRMSYQDFLSELGIEEEENYF
jgi:hypothetical protein